jgi:hypothetical protein
MCAPTSELLSDVLHSTYVQQTVSSAACRTAAGRTGAGAGEGLVAAVQSPVRQALVAAGRRRRRLAAHRRLHRSRRLQQVDICISRTSH